jgi:tellurite resistance protein TehA-like permease
VGAGCPDDNRTVVWSRAGQATRAITLHTSGVAPSAGTFVMGSAIVSTSLALAGVEILSDAVLAVAAGMWAALAIVLAGRVLGRQRERLRREATTPVALAGVAGTAVLADRLLLLGWEPAALGLLVPAAALWLALLGPVLTHWRVPTTGVSFLLPVSTLSLGLGLATLGRSGRPLWCLAAAALLLLLGAAAYGAVLRRFAPRQLLIGHGDHWVAGGAVALTALVTARLAQGVHGAGFPGTALGVAALVLLLLALVWLPVLVFCEIRAPRTGYHAGRWSTVFPLGMYAASSFVVGDVVRIGAVSDFARVWNWVGFAAWVVVLGALTARALRLRTGRQSQRG